MAWEGRPLVDGHRVRDAIPSIKDNARRASGGVQGKNSLDRDVHGRGPEGLEHNLRQLLAVGFGVEWGFGHQDGVLRGRDAELVVEGVVENLLHVVPVGDDAVLDGVLEGEDPPAALSLVPDIALLDAHSHHDILKQHNVMLFSRYIKY